jgi:hypothetical protein
MRYQEILEACWTGYRQAGMKKKGDRQVPNCVPVEEVKVGPEIAGEICCSKQLPWPCAMRHMKASV